MLCFVCELLNLTSRSYELPMFFLIIVYVLIALFPHLLQQIFHISVFKYKIFLKCQLLYQFFIRLYHLSIRNNFLCVRFLLGTFLFVWISSIFPTKYVCSKLPSPVLIWILHCFKPSALEVLPRLSRFGDLLLVPWFWVWALALMEYILKFLVFLCFTSQLIMNLPCVEF